MCLSKELLNCMGWFNERECIVLCIYKVHWKWTWKLFFNMQNVWNKTAECKNQNDSTKRVIEGDVSNITFYNRRQVSLNGNFCFRYSGKNPNNINYQARPKCSLDIRINISFSYRPEHQTQYVADWMCLCISVEQV